MGEELDGIGLEYSAGPPSDEEMDEQNALLLRRQFLFRWAAQTIAVGVSQVAEVQKLAAFGAVAGPLRQEVPRFNSSAVTASRFSTSAPIWTSPSG